MIAKKINSLYIHIPFCDHICPYCDFFKVLKNQINEDIYIDEVIKDINKYKDYSFKTVYIGGGTPSCLSFENLEKLLKCIDDFFGANLIEFTIEVNPESLSEEKLKLLKKYRINRISIGIQTFDQRFLKYINRDYEINIPSLINLTKKYISNINVDLIYGYKNQTLEDLNIDLDLFLKLDINHVSIYSLMIEEGTMFSFKKEKAIDDDKLGEFYDQIVFKLRENGFIRYEVSNFAKKGYESKHNLTYWKNEEYVGIGPGASGYENKIRYANSKSLTDYLKGIRKKDEEIVDDNLEIEYFLITNLRLEEGFNIKEFNNIYNKDLIEDKNKEINELLSEGLIILENDFLRVSDKGFYVLDTVLRKLI